MSHNIPYGSVLTPGADISKYQTTVDWNQFAAGGKKFCIIKASEALNADSLYASHIQGARQAKVLPGAYHFFHFYTDPIKQAQFFVETAKRQPCDLPLALDCEWADGLKVLGRDGGAHTLACLEEIEKLSGVTPILYTSASFFLLEANPAAFAKYPLWIASYRGDGLATTPDAWPKPTFVQYSDHGLQPGIGRIDSDYYLGSFESLLTLAK